MSAPNTEIRFSPQHKSHEDIILLPLVTGQNFVTIHQVNVEIFDWMSKKFYFLVAGFKGKRSAKSTGLILCDSSMSVQHVVARYSV